MSHRTPISNLIRAAQALFFLNALIWVGFGVSSFLRLGSAGPGQSGVALIVAALMFGNAAAMLLAAVGLGKRNSLFDYFAVAVVVVNIILTVTDQFGALDLATLVIDVIVLGLLVGILWRRR